MAKRPTQARKKAAPDRVLDTVRVGGTDLHAGEDMAFHLPGSDLSHGVLLPQSIMKQTPRALELLGEIQATVVAIRHGQEALSDVVAEARGVGVSWAAIGWSVGTTGEAARQRWGPA